jgi:galactokinase
MSDARARAEHIFRTRFGGAPLLQARAPGRVNLIGEHTDYNEGFVLPIAIDRAVWVAARPRTDREAHLIAADFGEEAVFSLDGLRPGVLRGWAAYPAGVAWALEGAGYRLVGMDAVVAGDVPIGSGLSSSAALEVAFAMAWTTLSGHEIPALDLARMCQRAENEFVGGALRDHGPDGRAVRPAGTCHVDRLPLPGDRVGAGPAGDGRAGSR